MKRALITISLALALVCTTASAAHAVRFAGAGVDDPKVRVSFEKEDGRIKRFTIENARFVCTDGDRFRTGTRVGSMELDDRDEFKGAFTSSDGSTLAQIRGDVDRHRASGRFRVFTFDKTVECDTDRVPWTARKR